MKKAAVFSALILAVLYCSASRAMEPVEMDKPCGKTFSISRGDSPWTGMTGSAGEEKASMTVKALACDPAVYDGFARLEKYSTGGEPLIFRARGKKIVGVNNKYFSDLHRADATRIGRDSVIGLGNARVPLSSNMPPEKLAAFLVESQLIVTYWHIGSELCLEKEAMTAAEYTAYFTGSHTYFTNKKNVEPLRFAVRINLETGALSVTGY
jgi:hypothetical protein